MTPDLLTPGLRTPDLVDPARPVNWSNPLTDRLRLWLHFGLLPSNNYLALSGAFVRELTRRSYGVCGSLGGGTHVKGLPGPAGAGGRPGIPGVMRQSGEHAVAMPRAGGAFGTFDDVCRVGNAHTVIVVKRKRDTTLRNSGSLSLLNVNGNVPQQYYFLNPWGDGNIVFRFGGEVDGTTGVVSSSTWTPDTNWHWWAAVVGDGQGMRLYLDGKVIGSNAATPTRSLDAGVPMYLSTWFAGSDHTDTSEVIFFDRGLSGGEINEWMRQSQAGHPDTLNWVRPHEYLFFGGQAAGGAAFDEALFPVTCAVVPPRAEPVPVPY